MQNIKKLEMQTPNKVDEHVQNILKLFPNVATEKEGKKVVDFDMLRQMLNDKIVEGDEERYRLDWVGKKASLLKANSSINKTLRPCVNESVDFENTQNLYIEGDNFEVLKLLSESYLNKIKMIYIDPPYNTGKDFVYRDNFTQSKADFEDEIGMRDEEGNKLFKNTDSNGRFHSDWLSMMYERLLVARDLLKEDGVIFISIDDNEVHNLRKICDEVFGEGNFVEEFIWNKKNSSKGVPPKNMVVNVHETVVCYAKTSLAKLLGELRITDTFSNPDNDERGLWRKSNIKSTIERANDKFTIVDPKTKNEFINYWAFSRETLEFMIKDNRILFPSATDGLPKQKEFFNEFSNPYMPIMSQLGLFHSQDSAEKEIDKMLDTKLFLYRKPLNLMKKIISQAGNDEKLIVLDFFSGSATTAHAVMQLNAEDGGNRKFIMVQLPETTDEKSDAFKEYKNICEIGKERIRRAGRKILNQVQNDENKTQNDENQVQNDKSQSQSDITRHSVLDTESQKKLDIGFRVLKIDTTNFKDVYYHPNELSQNLFKEEFSHNNIKEERTDLDLLFQIMLDLGIELSLKITPQTVEGTKLYMLENNELIACLEDAISQAAIEEIKKHKPYQVVLKDGCFADDNDKINALQELSNITTVSVI